MKKLALAFFGILFSYSAHAYIDLEKLDISFQGDPKESSDRVRVLVKGIIKDTQREIFAVIFDPILKERVEDSVYYPLVVYEVIKKTASNKIVTPYGMVENQEYTIIGLNDDLIQVVGTEGTVRLVYQAGLGRVVLADVEGAAKHDGREIVFKTESMVQLTLGDGEGKMLNQ